jgi:Na+/H+-dicarboxylate symporter
METLGRIGSKTLQIILLYSSVIAFFMIALACVFYPIQWSGSEALDFSQVLDLVYDIIPSNLFEPFITGNTLQLIFISVMVGLSMLVLSTRVSGIFSLVEQLSTIVQTMMTGLSSMLPVLIFFLFTGMISSGNGNAILGAWQVVLLILLLLTGYYVLNLFRIAFFKKISPVLLFKKALPTFMICLTTASSGAAYATNVRDAVKEFGIDKKLADFGIPIGQVLFMPGVVALLYVLSADFAQSYGIPITASWVLSAFITCLLVSFAIPPIPGGAMLGLTIVFTQLGIPMEAMGIALAVNAITDFPRTACNVSSWQLTMIDVADSLHMLDHEVLHKEVTIAKNKGSF